MSEPFITLKEALLVIDSGRPIGSITFVTADFHKDTGGEWIEMNDVRKHNWIDPEEYKKQQRLKLTSNRLKKNPNHFLNSTRNLVTAGGQIRKVHIRLIRKLNGKTVL